MKNELIRAAVAAAVVALAGCGQSDAPDAATSRSAQAIVDMCVADGGDPTVCGCTARALDADLDGETMQALAEFAQGITQAQGEQTRNMIAMGAMGNPKLVLALEKLGTAGKGCEQAAALDAAKAEVAAAQAARQARQKSAAGRRCPHEPALAARAPTAPIDDVAGLRPGMSFDDVEAVLECGGELAHFDVRPQWARNSQGLPTRQLLRAADGEPCPAELRVDGGQGCEDGGYGFAPLKDVTQEVLVAFAGMPGTEQAGVIWRRTRFPEGAYPTVSSLRDALAQKYGPPHLRSTQEGYYSLGQRRGTVVDSWVHAPGARPIARGDSARLSRCVNGPRPTFQARMSWNGRCGLTVRAEIVLAPNQTALARELNVVVIDQSRFDEAVKRFSADIQAAVEARQGAKAVKPTL
jgi:hypothetical protein